MHSTLFHKNHHSDFTYRYGHSMERGIGPPRSFSEKFLMTLLEVCELHIGFCGVEGLDWGMELEGRSSLFEGDVRACWTFR